MENPLVSLHSLNDLLHPDVPLCLSRIFCQKDAGSLIIYLKPKNIHRTFLINIMYIIFMHTKGNFVNLYNKWIYYKTAKNENATPVAFMYGFCPVALKSNIILISYKSST